MNGWTNHATWEMFTTISNDEDLYNRTCSMRDKAGSVALLAADLGKAFGGHDVNWFEIAESIMPDKREGAKS